MRTSRRRISSSTGSAAVALALLAGIAGILPATAAHAQRRDRDKNSNSERPRGGQVRNLERKDGDSRSNGAPNNLNRSGGNSSGSSFSPGMGAYQAPGQGFFPDSKPFLDSYTPPAQQFFPSSAQFFPPTSSGNVTPYSSVQPPINGPGVWVTPDGNRMRGGDTSHRFNNAPPRGSIPFGNGTLTPYPDRPGRPIPDDAPYERGPVRGSLRGKGGLSNILIFPGYRSTFIIHQTVASPFGRWYNCPSYIDAAYAIPTPYVYASGISVGVVQPWSDTDSFIRANPVRARELRTALNDLTRFWEQGDIRGLRRHLPGTDENIAVFSEGRFQYALRRNDFAALTSDALDTMDTISFRFVKVEKRDDGLIDATAWHQYRVLETGEMRTSSVRYSLIYQDGTYFISAVSMGAAN